jgi:hypothetical protein
MARGSDPYRQLMPIPKARLILKSPCDGKLKYVIFENVLFFNILIIVVTNYHIAVMEYHRNGVVKFRVRLCNSRGRPASGPAAFS